MARLATVQTVINRAAVEVGLPASNDVYADTDENYVQMIQLLNSAGAEMVELHPWQNLNQVFQFTTQSGDTGTYDLPDDFSYMIDQTGWDRTNRVSIGGPLTPQDWAYLDGRDLISQSIYVSFRMTDNKLDLYPQPPPEDLDIRFEYISRDWLQKADDLLYTDAVTASNNIVQFEPILIIKFLKCKWLEAKGFDPTSARQEFENMFQSRSGKDTGAGILSASSRGRGVPYLNPFNNIADTGFGL